MIRSVVRGFGAALPKRVVTNRDLESMVETSDEWIVQRTGIKQRYIAGEGETTASLGAAAAQQALDEGKIRLEIHRARSVADRCAQHLGYAVYRARMRGAEITPEEYARLASDLTAAEGEVARLTALSS